MASEQGHGSPLLYFEDEAARLTSPGDFLKGLIVIVDRKELDLFEDPQGNLPMILALDKVNSLIRRAKLGLEGGISASDEDTKVGIQRALGEIGFTSEEVNIFSIKSAAKVTEDSEKYAPQWAIEQIRERGRGDQEYEARLIRVAHQRSIAEREENWKDVFEDQLDKVVKEVARARADSARAVYLQLVKERLGSGAQLDDEGVSKEKVSASEILFRSDRARFLGRQENWRERPFWELEPISLLQFLEELRVITEETIAREPK